MKNTKINIAPIIKKINKIINTLRFGLISSAIVQILILIGFAPILLEVLAYSPDLTLGQKVEDILSGVLLYTTLSWVSWGVYTAIGITILLVILYGIKNRKKFKDIFFESISNLFLSIPAIISFLIFILFIYFIVAILALLFLTIIGQ